MAEVAQSMNFHRHDLFRIDASQWQALTASQGEGTRAFWLNEWRSRDWPVIVRRDDLAGALSDAERMEVELAAARQTAAQVLGSRAYKTAVKGRTTVENVVRAPSRWRKRRRGEL